jgi:alpha-tubulin suppressor-like RCC1 family protein
MTNADSGNRVRCRARTPRALRVKRGISSRLKWRSALAACVLFSAAACRDSSNIPTTGPAHFVLTAAGALVQGSASSATACVLTLFGGTSYCWGDNRYGTFGNGSTESSDVPVPSGGMLSFAALSVSLYTSCGIEKSSLALYCWGFYGDNLTEDLVLHLTPVLMDGSHKFKVVSQGSASGCAVTVDGDAYCWGEGNGGELGNGSMTFSSTPVKVSGDHNFKSIGVGYGTACGLTSDGDAYCWGSNDVGEVGSGNADNNIIATPQLVTGQHHFASLSVGAFHVCGLTQSGEAFCWGHNGFNELGIGTRDDGPHATPERVTGNLTFSALGAGAGSSCAITPRGVAYCWGTNTAGQLGNGTTDDSNVPVAVVGGLTFVSIGSGNGSACGITNNGDVYCWGDNEAGELGNGTNTSSLVPVKTHFAPTG